MPFQFSSFYRRCRHRRGGPNAEKAIDFDNAIPSGRFCQPQLAVVSVFSVTATPVASRNLVRCVPACGQQMRVEPTVGDLVQKKKVVYFMFANILSMEFSPLGKWSNLTNVFQTACNHQLVVYFCGYFGRPRRRQSSKDRKHQRNHSPLHRQCQLCRAEVHVGWARNRGARARSALYII